VHRQALALTALLAEAADGADWVLPLDADELLLPADAGAGGQALAAEAAVLAAGQVVRLHWTGYVPTAADDASEANPVRRS
jgi:hypothetical protein